MAFRFVDFEWVDRGIVTLWAWWSGSSNSEGRTQKVAEREMAGRVGKIQAIEGAFCLSQSVVLLVGSKDEKMSVIIGVDELTVEVD